jgi:hypothetical protein
MAVFERSLTALVLIPAFSETKRGELKIKIKRRRLSLFKKRQESKNFLSSWLAVIWVDLERHS